MQERDIDEKKRVAIIEIYQNEDGYYSHFITNNLGGNEGRWTVSRYFQENDINTIKEILNEYADKEEFLKRWHEDFKLYLKKEKQEEGKIPSEWEGGCKPALIASRERMLELSETLTKHLRNPITDSLYIKNWANEILYHCDIIEHCSRFRTENYLKESEDLR